MKNEKEIKEKLNLNDKDGDIKSIFDGNKNLKKDIESNEKNILNKGKELEDNFKINKSISKELKVETKIKNKLKKKSKEKENLNQRFSLLKNERLYDFDKTKQEKVKSIKSLQYLSNENNIKNIKNLEEQKLKNSKKSLISSFIESESSVYSDTSFDSIYSEY